MLSDTTATERPRMLQVRTLGSASGTMTKLSIMTMCKEAILFPLSRKR
ncbi:hypothetical protein [Methylobacterium sp. 77]|nr:hypothetical protein [Methylobacterium sp. 77]